MTARSCVLPVTSRSKQCAVIGLRNYVHLMYVQLNEYMHLEYVLGGCLMQAKDIAFYSKLCKNGSRGPFVFLRLVGLKAHIMSEDCRYLFGSDRPGFEKMPKK